MEEFWVVCNHPGIQDQNDQIIEAKGRALPGCHWKGRGFHHIASAD
jgi:hypothetical protein